MNVAKSGRKCSAVIPDGPPAVPFTGHAQILRKQICIQDERWPTPFEEILRQRVMKSGEGGVA